MWAKAREYAGPVEVEKNTPSGVTERNKGKKIDREEELVAPRDGLWPWWSLVSAMSEAVSKENRYGTNNPQPQLPSSLRKSSGNPGVIFVDHPGGHRGEQPGHGAMKG